MRYKVGDKVRVRKELIPETDFGGVYFGINMSEYEGKEAIVKKVGAIAYRLDIDEETYWWTDEILEPVEEMSAEEALKTYAEICSTYHFCDGCPIGDGDVKDPKECNTLLSECTEDTLLRLKHWKADHEKKPIETENVWYAVIMDEKRKVVYEEKLGAPFNLGEKQKEILKKYCLEHDGKYFLKTESRCVVKE